MNEMRLGRSLDSTLLACDGLLTADLACPEGVLPTDSSAGWAGNSLMCSGSRRTRLPNGAIVWGRDRFCCCCCYCCCWKLENEAKTKAKNEMK